MHWSWPVWVFVIFAVAALVCVAYGALRAMSAARVVKAHLERMKALPLLDEVKKTQLHVTRINADLAAIDELLARANAAIRTINDGINDMRIPQAVAAVRTAGAAIRLLFNHS